VAVVAVVVVGRAYAAGKVMPSGAVAALATLAVIYNGLYARRY
jgi:hypothetical protein